MSWAAAERGVLVTPMSRSAPALMMDGREGLLLGYAAYGREATREALRVLGQVIREHPAADMRGEQVAGLR